jgi:hypothetical protein
MTATLELINAISTGDASATQDAFNAAMAEKISAKLDDMRISVAQKMFNVQEEQPAVEGEAGQEEQE